MSCFPIVPPCMAIFDIRTAKEAFNAFVAGKTAVSLYYQKIHKKTPRQMQTADLCKIAELLVTIRAAIDTRDCLCAPFPNFKERLFSCADTFVAHPRQITVADKVDLARGIDRAIRLLQPIFPPVDRPLIYNFLPEIFAAAIRGVDASQPRRDTDVTCCICLEQLAEHPTLPGTYFSADETFFVFKERATLMPHTPCSNCEFIRAHSCRCIPLDVSSVMSGQAGSVYHTTCLAKVCKTSITNRLTDNLSNLQMITKSGGCGIELVATPCPMCSEWIDWRNMAVFSLAKARGR